MKLLKDVFAFVFGDDARLTIFAIVALFAVFWFRHSEAAWLVLPVFLTGGLWVSVFWRRRV